LIVKENKIENALLNLEEFCEYLGVGQTKARELLTCDGINWSIIVEVVFQDMEPFVQTVNKILEEM
jgi:hypothetical protein